MNNINLESVGDLQPYSDGPKEWMISEPISVNFFDKKKLKLVFEIDSEDDESFLLDADKAVINFLRKDVAERFSNSDSVYKNYTKAQNYYDSQSFGQSLQLNKEEIWNHIYPYEINVCLNSHQDENIYLLVYCGCEWEEEHGLQLVFKNGTDLTRISGIDCVPVE